MSYSDDVMMSLSNRLRDLSDKMYHIKKFNENIGILKDLNEILKRDIALREREYAIKLIELNKRGIKEEEIEATVLKLNKKGL
ncbi:MAG: hypothetical protein PHT75_01890 [Bacilli bacterium]|nr:hypothetical protein [Bacilli bacterium]MDD3304865.1 hypothetical protein [Bacilli bacterium]MDD4053710.1 hypothetical protein [Bacilli bacterium]MDD4411581.1 hypothetical protein [Bacilli bacterium]